MRVQGRRVRHSGGVEDSGLAGCDLVSTLAKERGHRNTRRCVVSSYRERRVMT